ncbi:MAG TPA: hypothetical protein VM120_12430 [Bryobacteraceae bacterium]|nr:hypothetical protein [Bryobacteraceae bacterium]
MAFCPKCGSTVEGRFCPSCGTSIAGDAPQTSSAAGSSNVSAAGMTENTAAALCYFLGFITGILFLVLEPYNKNPRIKFHAFQSIFFNLGVIVFFFAIGTMIWVLPTLMIVMIGFAQMLISLGIFVLWLFLMWKAYNGEKFVLPIVGPLAEAQASR